LPGEGIPNELIYPVLCLSKRAGISVVRSPETFGRCSAALFSAGFYTELRVVDASGAAYDVVDAEIVHPRSTLGQALARLFDANVRVDAKLRPAGRASLEEVAKRVTTEVSTNPEEVEEMTGRSARWWNETLETCADVADIVRKVDAATHTA
jgi:hypothetical protein